MKNRPSQYLKPVWSKQLQSPRTVELPLKPKSGANTPSFDHKPPSTSAPQIWAFFQLWAGTAQKSWICCSSDFRLLGGFWLLQWGGCSILWMCTIYCMISRSSVLRKERPHVLHIYIRYIYLHHHIFQLLQYKNSETRILIEREDPSLNPDLSETQHWYPCAARCQSLWRMKHGHG